MGININKSSGFSNINSSVFNEAFKTHTPETKHFNWSINYNSFPDSWKNALVIPIPKPGDNTKVEHFIPISLLPLPGKLLERVVHNQIEAKIENTNYFTEVQHGFRKKRATTHAILQLVNYVKINMDKKTPTVAIFIDFRKAFDCVCHKTLIKNIKETNLGPNTVEWIRDYLIDEE